MGCGYPFGMLSIASHNFAPRSLFKVAQTCTCRGAGDIVECDRRDDCSLWGLCLQSRQDEVRHMPPRIARFLGGSRTRDRGS